MILFPIAFLCTVLLIPFAIKLANKLQMVDRPNLELKSHRQPTPYLGGAVVYISVFLPFLVLYGRLFESAEYGDMILASLIVVIGGIFDDRLALSPLAKIGFQLAAALCVWCGGLHVHAGHSPVLGGVLTLLWLVGAINAFNLIDIMDGLASGVAAIASVFMGFLLLDKGDFAYSSLLFAQSGACLGFLLFNFNPARIFLGDAGSQLLGYMLAVSALKWGADEGLSPSLFSPVLILGVPLFETIFVIVLRLSAKRSPFRGSKDHFALRMVRSGYSVRMTVIMTCLFATALGLAAELILRCDAAADYGIIGTALVAALLIAGRLGRIDMTEGELRWRKS